MWSGNIAKAAQVNLNEKAGSFGREPPGLTKTPKVPSCLLGRQKNQPRNDPSRTFLGIRRYFFGIAA